ncbi:MAG: hypothetical protein M1839_009337 [Geoglossum umbratile]|nr:MAG: hypothetical protein M1839_009337 [Geoglossum umbratile]
MEKSYDSAIERLSEGYDHTGQQPRHEKPSSSNSSNKRTFSQCSSNTTEIPTKRQLLASPNSQMSSNTPSRSRSSGGGDTPNLSTTISLACCPMCGVEIEKAWLGGWKLGKRSSYRQKKKFCLFHRCKSAKIEWTRRGYPKIDWEFLPTRFKNFRPALDQVLSKGVQSDNFPRKPGPSITDQITLATAGYYGSRGLDLMTNYIALSYAHQIRAVAPRHTLIIDSGVASYILTVLAPELATQLIKDDMGISEEQARVVLRESTELGELLNDD